MSVFDIMAAMSAQIAETPAAASWPDSEWLAWFDAPVDPTYRPLSSRELLAWAADGRIAKFDAVLGSRQHPCYSLCRAAMILIERETTELDLSNTQHANMMGALQLAGVLSAQDVASLYSMAEVPQHRYNSLGIREPHDGDIQECRRRLSLLPE